MKHLSMLILLLALSFQAFAQEQKELTQEEKEVVALELEKKASESQHEPKVKELLHKVANEFKAPENQTKPTLLKRIGRNLGKASAWLTTTTAKPFINAAGFVTGAVEKKDKSKESVALYNFVLKNAKEFDPLYLQAGSTMDMIELMISKSEEIIARKAKIVLELALNQVGIKKEIPADLSDFELSAEEMEKADVSKLDIDAINNHPEYADVRPLMGDLSKQDLEDIVLSGYFDKIISLANIKEASPKIHELIGTLVAQIYVPTMVLGIVSSTLSTLYVAPVFASQVGTLVSATICLQPVTKEKFESDADLKSFCSYVTNRSAYQLMKSRAKGFVAGKKFRNKVEKKLEERKSRRAARKALRESKKNGVM